MPPIAPALPTLRGITHYRPRNTMTFDHSLPRGGLTRPETGLLLGAAVLLALAMLGPAVPASEHQHGFADQRMLWGLPCALDVLTNLPFALAGLWGLGLLRGLQRGAVDAVTRAAAGLFFVGLVLTSVGSTVYHLHPDDAGLLWDRLGMAVAFAGLLGLAGASRVSLRAGGVAAAAMVVAGPAAVMWWAHTGNLLPWAVVQLGGMLAVTAMALLPTRCGALALQLGAVMAWYGAAKLFEAADHAVFDALGQWVSGHSLKHLLAAGAALPVLAALAAVRTGPLPAGAAVTVCGQNDAPRHPGVRAHCMRQGTGTRTAVDPARSRRPRAQ